MEVTCQKCWKAFPYLETTQCPGCDNYFCDECAEDHADVCSSMDECFEEE